MAAGAWQVFGAAIEGIATGAIDLDTDTFRMALVTEDEVPGVDADITWDAASANEVSGASEGYDTHGKALTTVTVSRSGGTVTFDADDVSWTASTITAKYAYIVRSADGTTLAAGDLLVAFADLDDGGGSVSTTDGTFAVNMNASGIFTLARAA